MPVERVATASLPRESRVSKITKTSEWQKLEKELEEGLKKAETLRITFSPETLKGFHNDPKRTALAFALRLRKFHNAKYKTQIASKGTEIRITLR